MALEGEDEARRVAEAILADIRSGDLTTLDERVGLFVDGRDAHSIMTHVMPALLEAKRRFRAGDESPPTARLVAFALNLVDAQQVADAENAAARAERAAERRAATVAGIGPAPDLAPRMNGVGPHNVPLPDDASPSGDFLATRIASPDDLMAFYIAHLRGAGWAIDLDHSQPRGTPDLPPNCYFTHPDLVGRYLSILTGPSDADPEVTLLLITEYDD